VLLVQWGSATAVLAPNCVSVQAVVFLGSIFLVGTETVEGNLLGKPFVVVWSFYLFTVVLFSRFFFFVLGTRIYEVFLLRFVR